MKRWTLLPLLLLVMLMTGCDKRYTYTQYGRTIDGEIVANKQETIKAKTDIDAYNKALAKFGMRIIVSKQFVAHVTDSTELRGYTPFPYYYTLVTEKKERVSDRISEAERQEGQEKAFTFFEKMAKKSGVSLDRGDIVDRDLIK